MSLALQALLPLVALLVAALLVRVRPAHRTNGLVAAAGAGAAAGIALVELLRLAPGERVDFSYLTIFPYAELAIRLDALSLGFAFVTAATACLLMVARFGAGGDRRDPWFGWLITTAGALAVMLASNLLLLYIVLQLLTLAWSGALDETAPRRRLLRVTHQVSDLGLLFVAGIAIQSVGTSAYSGVPSDAIGPVTFGAAILPALTRIAALAFPMRRHLSPVLFEPAVAWAAPAGYLALRLLSLTGGRLPNRGLEVGMFAGALAVAAIFAGLALLEGAGPGLHTRLLMVQVALALGISALGTPLAILASAWLWLVVIALTGLSSLHLAPRSSARAILLANLAILPPSGAFIGLWIAGQALAVAHLSGALWLLGLVIAAAAIAAALTLALQGKPRLDLGTGWGLALVAAGAFPAPVVARLLRPVAEAVRPVPAGTLQGGPLGINVGTSPWPAAAVTLAVLAVVSVVLLRLGRRLPLRRAARDVFTGAPRFSIHLPATVQLPGLISLRRAGWALFVGALLMAIFR